MRARSGFTLVEMLVALTLFSILSLSVYSVFRSGLNVWRAGSQWSEENQTARTFFRMLSKELENSAEYSPDWPFEGTEYQVAFMTLQDVFGPQGRSRRELTHVSYAFDPRKKILIRRAAGKNEGFDLRKTREIITTAGLDAVDFSYAVKPFFEGEPTRWKKEWQEQKNIPRGVKIRFGSLRTAVFIPLGVLGDESE